MTTIEMEVAVARYFNPRVNIIVPNVSWGLGVHECDVLVLTTSGYAAEIEIKINKSDLLRDKGKIHSHLHRKIKRLYFAVPETLRDCVEHIPERAGFLVVRESHYVEVVKEAQTNEDAIKFDADEILHLAHLGTMRIWTLKEKLIQKLSIADERY